MSWVRRTFLRNVVFPVFFASYSSLAFAQTTAVNQKPVLSILSLTSKLQHRLLENFEKEKNISVRVEFVGSSKEFEPRIRATPRAWDLILCDERHLRKLVLSRILKPIPQAAFAKQKPATKHLEQFSKVSEEGRLYNVFMADPLGIVWQSNTLGAQPPVQWDWLSDTQKNPLWRGRLQLPTFLDFQYLIALKATKQNLHEPKDLTATSNWLRQVRSHIASGTDGLEMRYLTNDIVASVQWRSEFLALRKVVPGVEFGIPQSGTFFERYGFGFVGEVQNESQAVEFLNYVTDHQNEFASAAEFAPLNAEVQNDSPTVNWTLIEDEIPFPASVSAEVKKFSGAL